LLSNIKDVASIDDCLVGLEATGHYGENLINFLSPIGFKIGVINPIQTDALRNSNIRKTKTDKIDTVLITKCLMLGTYSDFKEKSFDISKLKTTCRFRFDVLEARSKLKIQLTCCLDLVFPELSKFFKNNLHLKVCYALLSRYSTPTEISKTSISTLTNLLIKNSRGRYSESKALELKALAKESIGINNPAIATQIKHIITQLSLLETQIKSIDNDIKRIMDKIQSPILTIPGIGYTLGSIIISEIGDVSRFSNPSKLLAFAGLDPSVKQSGNFNANTTRISKRGSKYLRYAIHRAASIIIWNNEQFHNYYTAKRAAGKSYQNAIGHVSGKLVKVIYKVLSDNIPFKLS
jgi:transposase